jgi:hypothetical protein
MQNPKKLVAGLVTGILCWNSSFAAIAKPAPVVSNPDVNAEELLAKSGDLRGDILKGLQDERVAQELNKMGIDKKEVQLRLAAMSDQELRQIQSGVQRQAGGDVVVLSVSTLLLIIIIILLIR